MDPILPIIVNGPQDPNNVTIKDIFDILNTKEKEKRFENAGIKNLASRVARDLERSPRTIERAIQFARQYPDIDQVPGGKNISWHVICNELLPTPTDKEKKEMELEAETCQHKLMCVKCKKMITK